MNYQHYKISLTVPLEKTQCEIVYFHYENMIFHMLLMFINEVLYAEHKLQILTIQKLKQVPVCICTK